ncbi:MAG TPA: recombinase family protein [Bryobacteraceae bacterium]|nr:recombinase family protein [Bryobacteraceae bacterium]
MTCAEFLVSLRKPSVSQRSDRKLICWASCVAKTYCVTVSIGDTFEQCRSATPGLTDDQDAAIQVAALGCERIFREKASGGRWDRPELHRLLDQLRKGDVLVVWKLDRLSRSLRDVLTIMERLGESGAGLRSLTEAIDTTTPAGQMMMQMVGAFAEFERAMLKERTRAGLDAAREERRIGGAVRSWRFNSRLKFARWYRRATRRPPTPHGCSKFIRRL